MSSLFISIYLLYFSSTYSLSLRRQMTGKMCKNCDQEIQQNFCAFCGQKTSVEPLTTTRLIKEVSDNVFQVNHGLFYSIKALTLHPALSINNYLSGKRKQYFQPIAYAFTLATLYYLITKVIGHSTFVDQIFEGYMLSVENKNTNTGEVNVNLIEWLTSNYAYTTLLLVPLFALGTRIAYFNGDKNLLEHLVLNLYITGHQSLIYGISAVIGLVVNNEDLMEAITLLCSMAYAIFVLTTFFNNKHVLVRISQALLSYIVAFLFIVLFLGVMMFDGS